MLEEEINNLQLSVASLGALQNKLLAKLKKKFPYITEAKVGFDHRSAQKNPHPNPLPQAGEGSGRNGGRSPKVEEKPAIFSESNKQLEFKLPQNIFEALQDSLLNTDAEEKEFHSTNTETPKPITITAEEIKKFLVFHQYAWDLIIQDNMDISPSLRKTWLYFVVLVIICFLEPVRTIVPISFKLASIGLYSLIPLITRLLDKRHLAENQKLLIFLNDIIHSLQNIPKFNFKQQLNENFEKIHHRALRTPVMTSIVNQLSHLGITENEAKELKPNLKNPNHFLTTLPTVESAVTQRYQNYKDYTYCQLASERSMSIFIFFLGCMSQAPKIFPDFGQIIPLSELIPPQVAYVFCGLIVFHGCYKYLDFRDNCDMVADYMNYINDLKNYLTNPATILALRNRLYQKTPPDTVPTNPSMKKKINNHRKNPQRNKKSSCCKINLATINKLLVNLHQLGVTSVNIATGIYDLLLSKLVTNTTAIKKPESKKTLTIIQKNSVQNQKSKQETNKRRKKQNARQHAQSASPPTAQKLPTNSIPSTNLNISPPVPTTIDTVPEPIISTQNLTKNSSVNVETPVDDSTMRTNNTTLEPQTQSDTNESKKDDSLNLTDTSAPDGSPEFSNSLTMLPEPKPIEITESTEPLQPEQTVAKPSNLQQETKLLNDNVQTDNELISTDNKQEKPEVIVKDPEAQQTIEQLQAENLQQRLKLNELETKITYSRHQDGIINQQEQDISELQARLRCEEKRAQRAEEKASFWHRLYWQALGQYFHAAQNSNFLMSAYNAVTQFTGVRIISFIPFRPSMFVTSTSVSLPPSDDKLRFTGNNIDYPTNETFYPNLTN